MRHVIYPTLAEKTMVAKVPQVFLFANLMITLGFWFLFGSLILAAFLGFIIWVVGVVYTRVDPDFAEIIFLKRFKLFSKTKTPNEKGNRYIS